MLVAGVVRGLTACEQGIHHDESVCMVVRSVCMTLVVLVCSSTYTVISNTLLPVTASKSASERVSPVAGHLPVSCMTNQWCHDASAMCCASANVRQTETGDNTADQMLEYNTDIQITHAAWQ